MLCKKVPLRQVHLAQQEAELHSEGFPADLCSRTTNQHSFHCGYTSKRLPLIKHKSRARREERRDAAEERELL